MVSWKRLDHSFPICEEEVLEYEYLLSFIEITCTFDGHLKKSVARIMFRVLDNLLDQRRYEIEGLPDFGKLLEDDRHIEVILCSMEPHPWKPVYAREWIFVIGLVHMPEERNGEGTTAHT